MMLDCGALTTSTPRAVAAGTSTLSSPMPARATTFSTGAAASASASIWVAERIRMASASFSAGSSAPRSAPSTCRMSNSVPSTSIADWASCSAISTTGFDTAAMLRTAGRVPAHMGAAARVLPCRRSPAQAAAPRAGFGRNVPRMFSVPATCGDIVPAMTTTPGYPDPNDPSRPGSPEPGWPTSQSPSQPNQAQPYQSEPYQSEPYQSHQSQPYPSQPYQAQPYQAQPYQEPYRGQPHAGQPAGGQQYPAPQYQQYPQAGYGQPGYGPPPGFPQAGGPAPRPGQVTGAAVLAFIVGGLILLVSIVALLAGGAILGVSGYGGLVITMSLVLLVVGALYLWAGAWALSGRNGMMLTIVAGVAAIVQVFTLVRGSVGNGFAGLAISIVIIVLMLTPPSRAWFRSRGAPTF